ncbi:MAG: GntR family transcriptional regulator [Alphaproteobacteria bacterium]|nr:GntR family transcriptional regulator [Alphaproteobacteria bacterium]
MDSDDISTVGARVRRRAAASPRHAKRLHADDATLAEAAYRSLTDQIVELSIPPGALVSEAVLSQRLGLGRTPIREATKLLARDYLVTLLPKRGIQVSVIDASQMLLILEPRRCLEPTRYGRAARRSTEAQRRQFAVLAEQLERARAAGDFRAQVRIDAVFDDLVDECAGNPYLTDALKPLHGIVRRFWNMHAGTTGYQGVISRHTAIVRAVASGDAVAAAAATNELLAYNETLLRAMIE